MSKYNKGFTITEMIVTIGILILVNAFIFTNYSGFRENISLKRGVQYIVLGIRQAQVYALGVKEAMPGTNIFRGYGVYVEISNPYEFILFADLDNDFIYDAGGGCGSLNTECVEKYKLSSGVKISNICAGSSCGLSNINIVFLRPNPTVKFKNQEGNVYGNDISIKVSSLNNPSKIKTIGVSLLGQISIQ